MWRVLSIIIITNGVTANLATHLLVSILLVELKVVVVKTPVSSSVMAAGVGKPLKLMTSID